MITGDHALADMVRDLAALSVNDRRFVLAQLLPSEVAALMPLLDRLEVRPLSTALAKLVAACADSEVPAGLTPRAAAAIAAAAVDDTATVETPRSATLPPPSWQARASALLAAL